MTKRFSIKFLATALFCMLFSIGQIFAQAGSGNITGLVADVNGAVVPNATVKIVSVDKGSELITTASSDGIFNFTALEPGKYTVSASGGSFAEQKLTVEVQVGRTTDANFTLGAGDVSAVVEVTAEGVQTTQSNSDAVLSETAISNLPINGRRFQDFATLTPTAQIDTERNQISLSGQRGVNANINVDGVDYNQPFFGGIRGGERSNFAPTIPQESIKEFQVVAAGYNAEFGRSSGGIVNVVTKGGTNDYRGSAFYLTRPDKFSRNHKFVDRLEEVNGIEITAAPTQTQYGGAFGGRIIKNKLFFFGSFEQQTFSADRFVLFTGLDAVAVNSTNQQAINYFRSQQTPYELTNDGKTALGRIDWNINNVHSANVRYSWNSSKGLNSVAVGDAGVLFNPVSNGALSNEGTEIDRNHVVVAQFTSTLSSSYVNDFRFQYARGDRPRFANAKTPLVTVTNTGSYGTRSFLPTTQFDTRYQFVEAFSILKGNHNIKIGGEFSDILNDQLFGFNQFGSYSFSGGQVGGLTALSLDPTNLADRRFDGGTFYTQQIGNTAAAFHVKELAFYGQDTWRVKPNFTLNFGLRLEKQYNPEAEVGNDAIINLVKNANFPLRGGKSFDPTKIPDSEWQVGPRLGFAWDLSGDGKSVFRGFTGVYYARTPGIILAGPVNNFRIPPGDVTVQIPFTIPTVFTQADATGQAAYNSFLTANPGYVSILAGAGLPCPQATGTAVALRTCLPNTVFRQFAAIGINANNATLDNLPSLSPAQLQQIAGILGLGITPAIGANLIAMDENFKNPRSFQFGFGYEKEVVPGIVFGIDYSQVNTTRLQRNRDINLPVPIASGPALRPTFNRNLRPAPQIGRLLLRESSARSLFRSLTFRTRMIRKWANINAYYTLSRNTSDDDNERNATGIFYDNTYDLRSEYGLARLDRTHQFVANPIFFLPYGFEVSSAIRLRSGLPVEVFVGSDLNGDSVSNDRPYLVPGVPVKRNAYRNQSEFGVDLRGQKGFKLGESSRLIFSAEIFNVFNNANIQFSSVQTNFCAVTTDQRCGLDGITNPTFLSVRDASGKIITSNFSRTPVLQMQFGARFQF
jgi:Carboxypeptidase regulatory-like domain